VTEPTQDAGRVQRWRTLELPWRGVDRLGEALELRMSEPRDAVAWVEHLQRITTETPWMLQSDEDPLPTAGEQRGLIEEYGIRAGSVAICAVRPGEKGILGTITLASGRSRRTEHVAELSMGVAKHAWGRGIGRLLMDAALTHALASRIVKRVSLSVFHDNEVARRLYERVGFATEGVLRRYVRMGTHHEDLVVMGIWLEDEAPTAGGLA
jgi:putative acetyltransferase